MVTKRIVNRMGDLPPCIHEGDASTGESRIGGILGIHGRDRPIGQALWTGVNRESAMAISEYARRLVSNDKVAGITAK